MVWTPWTALLDRARRAGGRRAGQRGKETRDPGRRCGRTVDGSVVCLAVAWWAHRSSTAEGSVIHLPGAHQIRAAAAGRRRRPTSALDDPGRSRALGPGAFQRAKERRLTERSGVERGRGGFQTPPELRFRRPLERLWPQAPGGSSRTTSRKPSPFVARLEPAVAQRRGCRATAGGSTPCCPWLYWQSQAAFKTKR